MMQEMFDCGDLSAVVSAAKQIEPTPIARRLRASTAMWSANRGEFDQFMALLDNASFAFRFFR